MKNIGYLYFYKKTLVSSSYLHVNYLHVKHVWSSYLHVNYLHVKHVWSSYLHVKYLHVKHE